MQHRRGQRRVKFVARDMLKLQGHSTIFFFMEFKKKIDCILFVDLIRSTEIIVEQISF